MWRTINKESDVLYTFAMEIKEIGCIVRTEKYLANGQVTSTSVFVPQTELVLDEANNWTIRAIPLPPMPSNLGGMQLIPIIGR